MDEEVDCIMNYIKRKPGRPKLDVTKTRRVDARLTRDDEKKLELLSRVTNKSKTEVLLDGLNMQYEKYLEDHKGKPILFVNTGQVFDSRPECCEKTGVSAAGLHDCLTGKTDNYKGLKFQYFD